MESNDAADGGASPVLPGFERLEQAVRRLLADQAEWRAQAEAAEQRCQELQGTLEGVRTGALDPRELGERVNRLQAENQVLRARVREAEQLVQRIHARLQLLEEER